MSGSVAEENGAVVVCSLIVSEAWETKKESHRTMKLFHGERIMASITHGSSLSDLRIWFMASLGQR